MKNTIEIARAAFVVVEIPCGEDVGVFELLDVGVEGVTADVLVPLMPLLESPVVVGVARRP